MKKMGVDVPTLPPPDLPLQPAPDTKPVPWSTKIRQPATWFMVVATLLSFGAAFYPMSAATKGLLVAAIGWLAANGIHSAFEFVPTKVPWTEQQKWAESYRRVYAGAPPIRGYVPGMDDDPYRKRPASSALDATVFATGGTAGPDEVTKPVALPPPLPPEGGTR